MPPNVQTSTVEEVLHDLGETSGRSLLVVESTMGFGDQLCPRAGVLDVTGTPNLLWDGFLPREDVAALASSLRARAGTWDAMFSTAWSKAWTDQGPFALWSQDGLLAEAQPGRILMGGTEHPVDADHVDTYANPGWVERGVRVVPFEGAPLLIVEEEELMAEADPTYDLTDLEGDAGWAVALGRALAAALAVPHFVTWR